MNRPLPDTSAGPPDNRLNRVWTIANLLCGARLVGSFVLVGFAFAGWRMGFLALFLLLAATDWIDGKLAVWLDQRSTFGARLDSWADAALYTALLIGGMILFGSTLGHEWPWLTPALATYGLSTTVGLVRFGRWPSYHTRAAKISWSLITLSAVAWLLDWSIWPLRWTMVVVTLTNCEAVLIGMILPEWRADVPSIWHAWSESRVLAAPPQRDAGTDRP